MGAHERPLFIELCGTVVSCQIFIRSQSLIARWTRNDLILAAVACDLYEACESMMSVEGQNRIFFRLVNISRFVRCVAK